MKVLCLQYYRKSSLIHLTCGDNCTSTKHFYCELYRSYLEDLTNSGHLKGRISFWKTKGHIQDIYKRCPSTLKANKSS